MEASKIFVMKSHVEKRASTDFVSASYDLHGF